MPVLPGTILLPRAISGHAKPGIPFPKGKHGQVREACWPLAQPPSGARIHLQPRLCAYVLVTAVMDFSCHVQDVLFSPLAKTPLRRTFGRWHLLHQGVARSPAWLLSSQCWRRNAEWQSKLRAPVSTYSAFLDESTLVLVERKKWHRD